MKNFKEIRNMTKDFNLEQNVKLAIYSTELVLPIFEVKYPHDNRPRKAIEAAKKCLESDTKENRTAATAAAYDAHYYTAWAANATDAATAQKILDYAIQLSEKK